MEAPPKINAALSPATFAGIVLGATALGVCGVVFFFNPSQHGFYPVCVFHQLTGLNCPGCGATRALYALLHGNFRVALQDNAFFILTPFAAGLRGLWLAARRFRGQPPGVFVSGRVLGVFLGLLLLFGVIRNLPGFEWLSPVR